MIIRMLSDDRPLSNKDALQLFYGIRKYISMGINLDFSNNLPAGEGRSDGQNPGELIVGIGGIDNDGHF